MNKDSYGTDISALVREALLDAIFMHVPYDVVEQVARTFVDARLKEADTIIASGGRMFTRTGKLNVVQELDWCIYFGLTEGLQEFAKNTEWPVTVALRVIDTVNENIGENPTWLTLLDGTSFVRCYRVHDVLYTETIGGPNNLVSSVSPATHWMQIQEIQDLVRIQKEQQ